MGNSMIIEKVRLEKEGNRVRLAADIFRNGTLFKCWFDYPSEYEQYVCTERDDAFLMALLPYALEHEFDIECRGVVSEKLYYQVTNYYVPILSKHQKEFHKISVSVESLSDKNLCKGHGVGTGISCGVDSFYSALSHLENVPKNYQLTHLVSMNVGSFGYQGGEFSYKWFQEELINARKTAEELNLSLIDINSNLMEFYQRAHDTSGTMRMVGAILGLQKLFANYYISAGFTIKEFDIQSEDNAGYDLLNLQIGTNESTCFYSTGMEASRFKRTEFISKFPVTYDKLTVCIMGNHNCSKCEKCLRTMGALYALGKLEAYSGSFDVNDFKKHKFLRMARIRYYGIGHLYAMYSETYDLLKKENYFYYLLVTAWAFCGIMPYEAMKKIGKKLFPAGYNALRKYIKNDK